MNCPVCGKSIHSARRVLKHQLQYYSEQHYVPWRPKRDIDAQMINFSALMSAVKPKERTDKAPFYGVFAHRNPVPKPWNDGTWVSRSAERSLSGPLPQQPPRITF